MNLHGIAAPIIASVNPLVEVTVQISTGSTTAADGSRTPTYARAVKAMAQVQPLTGGELRHMDSLNLQGDYQGIYINGRIDGLVRPDNKGGDKITLPDGSVYLVTTVLEAWPDWTKVAATLQNGA